MSLRGVVLVVHATHTVCVGVRFLGKVTGVAVRHGLQVGLNLPALVWRPLVRLPVGAQELGAVDAQAPSPVDPWSPDRALAASAGPIGASSEEERVPVFTTTAGDGRTVRWSCALAAPTAW